MYKISEVAEKTGFSISTLRYYEELGILKPNRSTEGYREYGAIDLEWVQFIVRLKNTGMSLKTIQRYSTLRELGDATIEQRMSLLDNQEKVLRKKKEELEEYTRFLQKKKATYKALLKERDKSERKE